MHSVMRVSDQSPRLPASSQSSNGRTRARATRRSVDERFGLDDFRRELVGIVSFGALIALLGAITPHLFPRTPVLHLDQARVHLGVGLLLCAFALGMLRAFRRAIACAVAGFIMCASVGLYALQHFAPQTPDRAADLSLISFNLLGDNPRGDDLAQFVIDSAPDIAVLLEAPAIHDQRQELEDAFPYSAGCLTRPNGRLHCDLAVFSRLPLENIQARPFYWIFGRLITAEVVTEAGRITLVAAHLGKPYWGDIHYDQLAELARVLGELDGPIILAGDFNSMPFVSAFRDSLHEQSGMKLASRMQTTWPALPSIALSNLGFAIDHVLVRGEATPVASERLFDPIGSNHRGLLTRFDLDGI